MALIYETPFVSGKDSLNNEFNSGGKTISIPHTLLISALAVMKDTAKTISMDFKKAGDLIYIVGTTFKELGGSAYFKGNGFIGNDVPKVRPREAKGLMQALSRATSKGLVSACHDLSEGGLGVALAEMAFAGGLGATASLKEVPLSEPTSRDDYILFSESNSRFLVEVAPENKEGFERVMAKVSFALIGEVNDTEILKIYGSAGKKVVNKPINELKEAWQRPLRW
jgi:phosphoribosylformylglycinamidine synthase